MAYTWTGGTLATNTTALDVIWADSLNIFALVTNASGTVRVQTSPDGSTWTDRTTPDQSSAAISWSSDAGYMIASGTAAVMTSTDGVTWASQTAPTATAGQVWGKAAYSSSLSLWAMCSVAAGTDNTSTEGIATASASGASWTTRTIPASIIRAVAWSPSLAIFVGVGATTDGSTAYAISSTDGTTWTSRTISNHAWLNVFWSDSLAKFVAVSYDMIATSTNGTVWSDVAAPATSADLNSGFAWAESIGTAMVINSTPQFSTSTDLSTWDALAAVTSPYGDQVFYSAFQRGAWSPTLNKFLFVAANTSTYEFLLSGGGTDDTFWYKNDVPGLESGVDATTVSGASARPKGPRGNIFTSPFSESNPLFGFPGHAVAFQNRMLYAAGDYTVGTDLPTIRVWNGTSDYLLAQIPKDGSANIPKCVTTMVNGDGAIYLGTWDTGTTSSNVIGRILKLDPNSGQLTNVGNVNSLTGYIPWALQFHNGELWVGMHRSDTSAGRIYRIKPNEQTSWTQDRDLSSDSVGPCTVITAYKGKMYFGTAAAAGTFAKFGSRDTSGTYGLVETASSGTARDYNGYYAACVFADNLYFSYWNPDTTEVSLIKKYDGTTVTTAKTVTDVADVPIIALFVHDGVLYALGVRRSGGAYTSVVLTTPDGTTWTDRTGDLPTTGFTSTGVTNAFASIAY